MITVSALAMTTIPSSLQYSYNWSPSSQSSPTNYISCRAIQNCPGSRKLPSPAVHPKTKMIAIDDDSYTNEKKTTGFVIHLLNNSRWLGALIWPQCAIFWPSLAPPADLVEYLWFNMAGTGVPHIVLLVLGSTCTSGRYFRPIYPSQRQNLLPNSKFRKKIPKSRIFSKISKTTKGPPMTSKGPPPPY